MTRATLLASALLLSPLQTARAEIISLKEHAATTQSSAVHFRLKIQDQTYDVSGAVTRPSAGPLDHFLLDTELSDIFQELAAKRGFISVMVSLDYVPARHRGAAIADLVAHLRKEGARRIIVHGRGEGSDALITQETLFDALLLSDPRIAPPKTRPTIEVFGTDIYWRSRAAPNRAEPSDNLRSYYIAGAAFDTAKTDCVVKVNLRPVAPALRALFVVLDEWLDGKKPPPSRMPKASDNAPAHELRWPAVSTLVLPKAVGNRHPKIDADGNELAGLRLPDQALPIATFTGFNASSAQPETLCGAGAAIPFASTKAEREKTGDPRPSLVERYGSRAYFAATMRVVADKLVKERLLLQEDADAYVAEAKNAPF